MKRYTLFILGFLTFIGSVLAATIEDGTYYISCTQRDGYVALGGKHGVDAYIYYVTDGLEMAADAYWIVTNTRSGYTFRNEASGELLVFTYDRVDQYYKYMTLASESLGDKSEYWNIIEGSDGAFSIQSAIDTDYYWNLRSGTNMLGTYKGSGGTSPNERYVFHKKEADMPDPIQDPTEVHAFPDAFCIYLSDGSIQAFPKQYVDDITTDQEAGMLVVTTTVGVQQTYPLELVDSVSDVAPEDFPTFDYFRFNKKSNDQLFSSVVGTMKGDTISAEIGAIGKRLTPTFAMTDIEAHAYIDGVEQISKENRLRFDKDIYYLIAREDNTILLPDKGSKEGYSMQPFGRFVCVHVDWLTDRAEVPTIYINTYDGQAITSKDYYKDAEIIIDGHGIFPSMDTTYVQIKGRGNSSWSWPKKPYRLKFPEKVKPLGMTKGKSWVLLSNYQTGSLMSNAIGMKAANLMGTVAANHIVPVDVYLNGEYRGSYNFTEKVGFSNNSVELVDETAAALLEFDTYYDEPVGQKFRSSPYSLPINVKEPDFTDSLTVLTLSDVETHFNRFLSALYRGQDISRYVDIEQLARFMMVNELTLNYEFYHPKSTFCYREDYREDTCKYIFGPVWDLDWGFGYERNRSYFQSEATINYWTQMPSMEAVAFIQDLRFKYQPLSDVYQTLWEEFMENDLQELLEYAQDYYDFAQNSFVKNRSKWNDNTNYAQQAKTAASWLETRSQQIYQDIINNVRPDMPDPVDYVAFDDTKLYTLTCKRGQLVLDASHSAITVTPNRSGAPAEDYQFAIIGIEGNNYLYSPAAGKFVSYQNNGQLLNQLGTAIQFDTSSPDGEYLYMLTCQTESGKQLWFNHNSSVLVINDWSRADDGNRWKIVEVGDFDPTDALELAEKSMFAVTNRYLFNGEVVGQETRKLPAGALPPEPSSEWTNAFVSLEEPDDMPYQISGETTIDYNVLWQGPFLFSTSQDDASWYNMTIRTNYFVSRQDAEPYYPAVADEYDLFRNENFFWAFGGNPYQVKVYNFATGFDETLTQVGDMAVMRQGDFLWDLLPHSDGFVLRLPGTEYTCINQYGGNTGPLMFWDSEASPTDDGSTFRLYEANATGINSIHHSDFTVRPSDAIYNVAGQRLSKLRKGINIVGGKKILVR